MTEKVMSKWVGAWVLRAAAVAFACLLPSGCSREKVPEVFVNEKDDPAYWADLRGVQREQQAVAKDLAELRAKIDAQVAKARAALAPGASDELVNAELEGRADRYPAWRPLRERYAGKLAELEALRKKMLAVDFRHLQRAKTNAQEVAAGRARAKIPERQKGGTR